MIRIDPSELIVTVTPPPPAVSLGLVRRALRGLVNAGRLVTRPLNIDRVLAHGVPIPKIENIHQKVYAAASQPGALTMACWHGSDGSHCRAGWVVTLAGYQGRLLEDATSTSMAATLIYRKSDPRWGFQTGKFVGSNEAALADMKACAEREAARWF